MKVMNYLELELMIYNNPKYDHWENEWDNFIGDKFNMSSAEFYSQPFEPDKTPIEHYFKVKDKNIIIDITDTHIHIGAIDGEHGELYHAIYSNFIPKTLDDFIRDCQRAGIELEWK